ncbi:hypothetical protein V7968_23410 [Nocardia vulneris]
MRIPLNTSVPIGIILLSGLRRTTRRRLEQQGLFAVTVRQHGGNVTVDEGASTVTVIPAAIHIGTAVSVDPDGYAAVVCGTATNRYHDPRRIELVLEEHYGRTAAFGSGVSSAIPPDGATHPWSVLITTDGDPFCAHHSGCATAEFEHERHAPAEVAAARVHFY